MKLMEEKYTPKTLEDIISPKSTDLLLQLSSLLREQKNILFIGTNNTFKSIAMRLAMEEYYDGNPKDSVLVIDTFKDLSFYNNEHNELRNFCRSSTKKKCVMIENFDIIHENNQQYLKEIMDESPKILFLFGCENTTKINEIIQTRVVPLYFEPLTRVEYRILIERISEGEKIVIKNMEVLLEYPNLTIYYIYNLFNKLTLLGLSEVDDLTPYITLLDTRILENFFETLAKEEIKEATLILFGLYEKGYSLLDIYYFIYEFLKVNKKRRGISYLYIEKICFYIQHIYDGYDTKVMLLFLTNELFSIYKNSAITYGK
jgi:DNA polymerase III delta prime subunit